MKKSPKSKKKYRGLVEYDSIYATELNVLQNFNSALALCPTSYDDGSNSMGTLNTNEGTEYVQLHEILEKQEEDFDFSEMQPTERYNFSQLLT